jgi:hypothetical protein
MAELAEGAKVRHSGSGREGSVVRRVPSATALGLDEPELERDHVYEVEFADGESVFAPVGSLTLLEDAPEA